MARRRNPHEFQDGREENSSGVGDLPADIGYERREHRIARGYKPTGGVGVYSAATPGARTMPPNAVPDIRYQSKERAEVERTGVPGTMSQGASVRSTYDARPINARDWLEASPASAPITCVSSLAEMCFTVPEGYVGILREFRFEVDPIVSNAAFTNFLVTITVDDIPQSDYIELQLGQITEDWIPTYILANEMQRICLRMDAVTILDIELHAVMHGNLLLRTGVPIEYEPGNPSDAEPIVRGTVLKTGGGVETEPPTVARRPLGGSLTRARRKTTRRYY